MGTADDESYDVEREVAFAALGGWEKTFAEALERYCAFCRGLAPQELQRRPEVLLDFNVWANPRDAVRGSPLGGLTVAGAARYLARRMERHSIDPYAILGTLARECGEK